MAYAVVNPTGCAERYGLVQVRLDMCLEEGDTRFADPRFYVIDTSSAAYLKGYTGKLNPDGTPKSAEAYAAWLASLPRIWLAERCFHHHFIYLDPYTLKDEQIEQAILAHLPNFYRAWLDERDHEQGGMRHGWDVATRIRPVRFNLAEPERYDKRKALCLSKLPILAASPFATRVSGLGETFPSTDIDVGSEAIDRGTYRAPRDSGGVNRTDIDGNNAANASGTIDTVESYWAFAEAGNEAKVGTFSKSDDVFTCRDAQSIGEMAAGSKQTDTGLDIDIEAGDFIGVDARTAKYIYIEAGAVTGDTWEVLGQYCDPSDSTTFGLLTTTVISLYGTGETAAAATQQAVGGGSITPAGTLSSIFRRLTAVGGGAVTPTGSLSPSLIEITKYLQSVGAGTIAIAGALGRKVAIGVGAGPAPGWVSPTGHSDPDSAWTNEANAYDGNTGTYATAVDNGYLELSPASPIRCDKVRIWATTPAFPSTTVAFYVDVYYDSAWHNLAEEVTHGAWDELAIGSTETVEKARIARHPLETNPRLHEFAFNDGASAGITPSGSLSSIYRQLTSVGAGALTPSSVLSSAYRRLVAVGNPIPTAYRVPVTLLATAAGGATQTDFPVCITQANVPDHFFSHVNADGSDVIVTLADGVTRLKREFVAGSFSAVAKTLELHIKVPSYSHTVDTVVYLHYGNADGVQTNDLDTWNSSYVAVYHMNDNPADSTQILDSTANGNTGTKGAGAAAPTEVAGSVGRAQEFVATNGTRIRIPTSASLQIRQDATWTWLGARGATLGTYQRVLQRGASGISHGFWNDNKPLYNTYMQTGYGTVFGTAAITDSDWRCFGLTFTYETGFQSIFINGVFNNGDADKVGELLAQATSDYYIGAKSDGSQPYSGLLDELRLSSVARSREWNAAEDAWLRDNANCYTVGAVEYLGIQPAGTLGIKILISLAGAVTIAGTLGRKVFKSLGGVLTPTGSLGIKILRSVGAGAVPIASTINRKIKKAVGSGAVTLAGALTTFLIIIGRIIRIIIAPEPHYQIKVYAKPHYSIKVYAKPHYSIKVEAK